MPEQHLAGLFRRLARGREAAAQLIEIIAMLEEKTRGNLTAEERQLIEQVLFELRMRYVEAKKSQSPIILP